MNLYFCVVMLCVCAGESARTLRLPRKTLVMHGETWGGFQQKNYLASFIKNATLCVLARFDMHENVWCHAHHAMKRELHPASPPPQQLTM